MVEPNAVTVFNGWESFYVIIGSSAAALTGLQFVVITLGAEARTVRTAESVNAFGTPTIVHFCAVLLVSAILNVPWRAVSNAALSLGLCAVAGIVYMAIVVRRTVRQKGYAPVLEDWIWHCALPTVAYVTMLGAALFLRRDPPESLLVIGVMALLLLFIGIHNAWDAVTYIAAQRGARPETPRDRE